MKPSQDLGLKRIKLQVGDEIIYVNGQSFDRLTHDEAVNVLKSSHRLDFVLRYIGKVPHSSLLPNRLANSTSLSTCTSSVASTASVEPSSSWLLSSQHLQVQCTTYLTKTMIRRFVDMSDTLMRMIALLGASSTSRFVVRRRCRGCFANKRRL